jgi:hypothetical protein
MYYNKNKVNLHVDIDSDADIDNIEEDINTSNSSNSSNQLRFKTYVNGIVKIQNIQDFIIRLSIISGLFIISCPRFFTEVYFLNNETNKTNTSEYIYLKVSILEQLLSSVIIYYFVMAENLDDIYHIKYDVNSIPNLILIGKLQKNWGKYYSCLGIVIAGNYYFSNGYLTSIYMYILGVSIFRLLVLRYFQNKINKNKNL